MPDIGPTASRFSAACAALTGRAVLAGAAMLAGASLRPAHGAGAARQADELAIAMPRVRVPGGMSGVGLPQPLPPSEAARVRRIFGLQRQGAFVEAAAETGRLTDDTLLGHVLANRLLLRPARATAVALSDWLGRYADLPDAPVVYALLRQRLPASAVMPPAPADAALGVGSRLSLAGRDVAGPARDAFLKGRNAAAERLGREAFEHSRGTDGEAAYVAGLAAWRQGRFAEGRGLFEAASLAEGAGAGLRAAAAFWAARVHGELEDAAGWRAWMMRAAAEPHTLHGILARQMMGLPPAAIPASPTLSEADVDAVGATPHGRRAFALLQVGEKARAEAELRLLWAAAQSDTGLARALFVVAGAAGLPELVADLSGRVGAGEADLPAQKLRPRGGFRLAPALVYAVAHVESNFDSAAQSDADAHGLMQLRTTATDALGRRVSTATLREPGQNLRFGQEYLAYLGRAELAGDDLLRVLASYNAGPGAVGRWGRTETDPLLFIETIPTDETRRFVQRTLADLWAYAARFGEPCPSLVAMAAGQLPALSAEAWSRGAPLREAMAVVRLH